MSVTIFKARGTGTACEGYDTGNIAGLKANIVEVDGQPAQTGQMVLSMLGTQHLGGGLYRSIVPGGAVDMKSPLGDSLITNLAGDYQLHTLAELDLPPDPAYDPAHAFLTNLAAQGVDTEGHAMTIVCFNFGAQMVKKNAPAPWTTSNPIFLIYRASVEGPVRGFRQINEAITRTFPA